MDARINQLALLLFIYFIMWMPPLFACPFCQTPTGQQVHAGIFNENFWPNVLITALPFGIFALITWFVYSGFPARKVKTIEEKTDDRQ